jgi:hypothetical protein
LPLDEYGRQTPKMTRGRFGPGIEDAIILPLVIAAFALKRLGDAALRVVIHVLDYAFPILLQLMRFPLFTLRIAGDAIAAVLKGMARWLPMSSPRRERWREFVGRQWSWLRERISYSAFEDAVHHAFERGMAWVFRKCRSLTPGRALLVTGAALLWLPVSLVAATTMHAILIAQATTLPAWMQLLHPMATIIAKTKLLVLPVFPAAWPQTRKHRLVQALFRFARYVAGLHLVQKTAYRYRQTRHGMRTLAGAIGRAASDVGLTEAWCAMQAAIAGWAVRIGRPLRAAAVRLAGLASALPLVGTIVDRYAAHYDSVEQQNDQRMSDRAGAFFDRWSIKFSAEYYEAKDKAKDEDSGAATHAAPP